MILDKFRKTFHKSQGLVCIINYSDPSLGVKENTLHSDDCKGNACEYASIFRHDFVNPRKLKVIGDCL
jgi:hypothetical protein